MTKTEILKRIEKIRNRVESEIKGVRIVDSFEEADELRESGFAGVIIIDDIEDSDQ